MPRSEGDWRDLPIMQGTPHFLLQLLHSGNPDAVLMLQQFFPMFDVELLPAFIAADVTQTPETPGPEQLVLHQWRFKR